MSSPTARQIIATSVPNFVLAMPSIRVTLGQGQTDSTQLVHMTPGMNTLRTFLGGMIAALPIPFGAGGELEIDRIDPVIDFIVASGIRGVCIGGATGEYSACSVDSRLRLLHRVMGRIKNQVSVIVGVGAGNAEQVIRLSEAAASYGSTALLLPPPHYFRYDPHDVVDFIGALAPQLPLPVLLYHIPQFTNQISLKNMLNLVETTPNVVGIKDSSGAREHLPLIATAKTSSSLLFFSGDDSLLYQAQKHGADGAISGLASACPELLLSLYSALEARDEPTARALQAFLDELIVETAKLPTPWGIKLALGVRGYDLGRLSWPISLPMKNRINHFRQWFDPWICRCLQAIPKQSSLRSL